MADFSRERSTSNPYCSTQTSFTARNVYVLQPQPSTVIRSTTAKHSLCNSISISGIRLLLNFSLLCNPRLLKGMRTRVHLAISKGWAKLNIFNMFMKFMIIDAEFA